MEAFGLGKELTKLGSVMILTPCLDQSVHSFSHMVVRTISKIFERSKNTYHSNKQVAVPTKTNLAFPPSPPLFASLPSSPLPVNSGAEGCCFVSLTPVISVRGGNAGGSVGGLLEVGREQREMMCFGIGLGLDGWTVDMAGLVDDRDVWM